MHWHIYIANIAVGTTILQFLSGTLVCKKYVKKKSTGESSPLPFLTGFVSCSLWLLYGIIKDDDYIIFTNLVGVALMTAYTLVFFKYSMKKNNLFIQYVIVVLFLLIVVLYVRITNAYLDLITNLGFIACTVTIMTVASPLSKFFYVVKTRDTDCLPFPMILMSFFVSLFWSLYGILIVDDQFIILPNVIGVFLTILQLSLFVIFRQQVSLGKLISEQI